MRSLVVLTVTISIIVSTALLARSQEERLFSETEPITPENADQVIPLMRLGYGAITDIAFSPNGQYLAVGTGAGVVLYTMDTLAEEPRFFEGSTGTVAFSQDSKMLAATGHLWDVETGDLMYEFGGYSPVFSPDGNHLITGSGEEIIVQDVETGEEIMRQDVNEEIRGLSMNPDGSTLAIDVRGNIILWSFEGGAKTTDLADSQYPTIFSGETAFSPDGKLLLHAGFDGYVIWRVDNGAVFREQDTWFNPDLNAAVFSPDGSQIAIGDANTDISVYNTITGDYTNSFSHEDELQSVAFSTDGTLIAAAAINGIIHIWDIRTHEEYARLTGFGGVAQVIGFSDTDNVLTAASIGGAAWQWNVDTGEQIGTAQGYKFYVSHGTVPYPSTIELNENANLLATGSVIDGHIYLWTPNGRSRGNLDMGVGQDIRDVAFTRDTNLIAALSYDNVFIWELDRGSRITGLRVRDRGGISLAFSPDGAGLAIGDQTGRTTLQDRVTARVIAEFQGPEGDVTNLIFSPDGEIVAFTNYGWNCSPDCYDYVIRLWDARTGELLHSLEGHSDFVEGLAFSPDGLVLASIAEDGTLRFWNSVTGVEISVVQASASTLAFNNGGTILATNGADGIITLWGVG